jgi:hypothetical protein
VLDKSILKGGYPVCRHDTLRKHQKQDLLQAALHRGKLRPPGAAARVARGEQAFADERGPDPRTKDSVGGVQSVLDDPLR